MTSKLRIVEWEQSLYADMPQKCWTIVTDAGYEMAGTFWERETAEQALKDMSTAEENQQKETDAASAAGARIRERWNREHGIEPRPWEPKSTERDEETLRQADMTVRHPEGI